MLQMWAIWSHKKNLNEGKITVLMRKAKLEGSCIKTCLNCNGNLRANSERCPAMKKKKNKRNKSKS
jgi:hypothetical protein